MEITTDTLSEAHEAACDAILDQHKDISILTHPDKEEYTLEFEGADCGDGILVLRILHPLREDGVSKGCPFQEGFTRAYEKQFLTITPKRADGKHPTYTYYNRMKDYPYMDIGGTWIGDGDGMGYDQITGVVAKLAERTDSRRGVMVTWNPLLDTESIEPPCMDMLQAIIRSGKLHLRVVFRSQDMLLGLPENLVGISVLHNHLTHEINRVGGHDITVGEITVVSLTPHIYNKRDSNHLNMMRHEIHRKKTLGLWHPQISQ